MTDTTTADKPEAVRLLFMEAMEWGKYFWAPQFSVPDETLRVVSEGFADKAIALIDAARAKEGKA